MAIFQILLSLGAVMAYLYWLFYFFRSIEPQIKQRVAHYFQVKMITDFRGYWKVTSKGNWWRNLGIELLQICFLIFFIFAPFFLLIAIFFLVSRFI
jgi:hypothetical protein